MLTSAKARRLISKSPFKIGRIDWYVFTEVLGPFLGGVLFFTFVFLMFQALRLAEFFIVHGIPGALIFKLSGLLILSFMPMALPVAFLIAVLSGFGRLSADSELVAMKANGVSAYRMAIPTTVFAMAITLISLVLNLEWVPWGERAFKGLLIKVSNTKVVSAIKEGTFTSGFFDLLVYANKVDTKTNRLSKVFIYDERKPTSPYTVIAREGEIIPVDTGTELGAAVMFRLFSGNIHNNDVTTAKYQKIDFGIYRLYLNIAEGENTAAIKPKMLSYGRLRDEMHDASITLSRKREVFTEFWRRYTVALSPLIFVFLGIGYGTVRTRSVRSSAIIIAFVVVLLYWGLQATGISLANKGTLPPWLAMWMPNMLMAVAAVHGFRKATW